MVTVRVIADAARAAGIAHRWRELLTVSFVSQIVMTPTWLLAWWRVFGEADGRRLALAIVEHGGALVGLAPLSLRTIYHRGAVPVRVLELLATGESQSDEIASDYVGVAVAAGHERLVARALSDAICGGGLGTWDELRMPAMSGEDIFVPHLAEALRDKRALVRVEPGGDCPYVPLPASWDEYLAALGSERRYAINRSLRDLDAWAGAAGWRLCRATTPAELDEGKRILMRLHSERWRERGRDGVFASARFSQFHGEIMDQLLGGNADGSLDLLWLEVAGEPVAIVYNLVHDRRVAFYQAGRKLDVPHGVKPGIALHALALRDAIDRGLAEYDFLGGASSYKHKLALRSRPLVGLFAVAPTLRARATQGARVLVDRAVAAARRAVAKR